MDFRLKDLIDALNQGDIVGFNPCSNGLSAQRVVNFWPLPEAFEFQSLF